MDCPDCGGTRRPFSVPAELRSSLPGEPASVALCPTCLAFDLVEDPETELTDFSTVSDTLPDDREAAAALVFATALLSSLARNRQRVDALLEHVEAAGVDPLLALDRLAADPTVDPAFDVEQRRSQLLQLRD